MNTPTIYNRNSRYVTQHMTSGLGPGMHPRVSIKGGRFTLIDAGGSKFPWPNLTLPVIIIGANPKASKIYYEEAFDPDVNIPPTCYSDNGIGPSTNASVKQARTCAECPHFGWGSAHSPLTGRATKACDDKKKIAVIVLGDQAGHAYELQIPPASLKNLNVYGGFISSRNVPDNSRRADVSDVVTLISFEPDKIGVLKFDHWGWIDSIGPNTQVFHQNGQPITAPDGGEWIANRIDELCDSNVVDELCGLNDQPWTAPTGFIPPGVTYEQQPYGGQLQRGSHPQGNSQVAYQPPQPAQTPFAGPQGAVPQQPQTLKGPAPTPRRGRPKTTTTQPAVQAQPTQQAPFRPAAAAPNVTPFPGVGEVQGNIPDFLRRQAPSSAQAPTANSPFAGNEPPPSDLSQALDKAFNLNTTRGV